MKFLNPNVEDCMDTDTRSFKEILKSSNEISNDSGYCSDNQLVPKIRKKTHDPWNYLCNACYSEYLSVFNSENKKLNFFIFCSTHFINLFLRKKITKKLGKMSRESKKQPTECAHYQNLKSSQIERQKIKIV